jgi:hypothetical protein
MRVVGVVLISWWLYVNTFVLLSPYPFPLPRPSPYPASPAWGWVPRERFLHQEFCELRAKQLHREGLRAICWFVND